MANTITVACPNCGNQMRASVKHIGRKGRCSRCGNLVTIVASEDAERSALTLQDADADETAQTPSGTEVNHVLAGLIGLVATLSLYIIFYLLDRSGNYLGIFMTERSIIQHMITLVTCWGLAILVLKYLAVKRELRSTERELDLIPLEIGLQINASNVDKFLDHLRKLPHEEQDSFIARRLRGALEHFKHRNNVQEVQSYLATQADIEASAVDSGYTQLRVFIWVCPILGFIGTVLGIGWAVTDLAAALPEASAVSVPADAGADLGKKLLNGMRNVTDGLATAFDTTLLGLVCVVILMFPTEALKKIEYGMLDRVQGFANESLLRRMAEGDQAGDGMPEVVQKALDSAFKEHQRWLAQWQAQVAKLGHTIGADFETHLAAFQDRIAQGEAARLDGLNSAAKRVEALFGELGQITATWMQSGGSDFKNALAASAELHRSLDENTASLAKVLDRQGELMKEYSRSDLAGVLRALHDAIARLADARQAPAPPAPPGPPAPAKTPDLVLHSDAALPSAPSMLVPLESVDRTQPSDARSGRRPGFFGRLLGREND
jgi:biopolymer transport protein ExbB/TolQ